MSSFFTTMIVAVSENGLIADENGNGDFSSAEDKHQLRAFLHGDECDCFVCGRKTADEFKKRLDYKPLFILTRHPKQDESNITYVSTLSDLFFKMQNMGLFKAALLGGAETYHAFLKENVVDKIILTRENTYFQNGLSLDLEKYIDAFELADVRKLGLQTEVSTYVRKSHLPPS